MREGKMSKSVLVNSNDEAHSPVRLTVSATVIPIKE
jgi:hypothetical protein